LSGSSNIPTSPAQKARVDGVASRRRRQAGAGEGEATVDVIAGGGCFFVGKPRAWVSYA